MFVLAFVNIGFHLLTEVCGLSLISESENRIGVCFQIGYGDCQAHDAILGWYAGIVGESIPLVKCLCSVGYDVCDESLIVGAVDRLAVD